MDVPLTVEWCVGVIGDDRLAHESYMTVSADGSPVGKCQADKRRGHECHTVQPDGKHQRSIVFHNGGEPSIRGCYCEVAGQ